MATIRKMTIVSRDLMSADGKHYIIFETLLEGKRRYGVIDHDNVDKNGKLIKEVNGIQMLLSDTVSELIERVGYRARTNQLVAQGIDRTVAAIMAVTKMSREEAEKAVHGAA